MTVTGYQDFLKAKVRLEAGRGFPCSPDEVNPYLKPHQRAVVAWAVRMGYGGLFLAFGLGKTLIQLEILRLVLLKSGGGKALVVLPLNVKHEFVEDAAHIGLPLRFVQEDAKVEGDGVYLTNYESVREGKITPRQFKAVSLDEASILRGFGGTKTFREFMATIAGDDRRAEAGAVAGEVPFRFVATATPSPNEYIELLAYAAFLGAMDVGQAKTRFFKRDSTKADRLTLHPHKEDEFWLWMSSWALFVQKPSDLGFSDEGYDLPPLDLRWHEVPTDHRDAGAERDGQGRLLKDAALGVVDASREKRASLKARVAKLLELRVESPAAHRVLWHDLEVEREALEDAIPKTLFVNWREFKDGNPTALALYERHYSAYHYKDGRERKLFCGPGFKFVLMTESKDALFVWRKFIDDSGQEGVNCAVFRNEGAVRSSDLIEEAVSIAWARWPGQRLYTYVDPDEIKSPNPGYCFLKAGWRRCGKTKNGLIILERIHGPEELAYAGTPGLRSVYGTQDLGEREQAMVDFAHGRIPELAAKPVIAGSGCNFQKHCNWAIFLGIGFKFNDFVQAIHRLQRFGQKKPVRVDLIYTEAEREVRKQLEAKWARHQELVAKMAGLIRERGLAQAAAGTGLARSMGVTRETAAGPGWEAVLGDCVEEVPRLPENSVGLWLTSVPFATQYEYSPSYRDFGHTDDVPHFFRQMDFLTPALYRALMPGRLLAVHVKDRITPMGLSEFNFQTVQPFHADCIAHYLKHGFGYLGMKTIVTDVVRENAQTYRLGWTEQCKDGSKMGVGMPEYLLLFRKPSTDRTRSYADLPVVKSKEAYTRARWQFDAHGFTRSSGQRLLSPKDFKGVSQKVIFRMFRDYSKHVGYDFERDVKLAEALDKAKLLPPGFMLLQPQSHNEDVWTDIVRMRTLNSTQASKGFEMHLCPLQFDLVDRAVAQFTNLGELVADPFGGLMTVPLRAVRLGRRGWGVELNPGSFRDGVWHLEAQDRKLASPTLFDLEKAVDAVEEAAAA